MGTKAFEQWLKETPAEEDTELPLPTSREESGGLRQWLGSGNLGAFIDKAANAITLGGADEAKAALYSALSPKSYGEELGGIREHSEELGEKHKAASLAGSLTGGVLSGAVLPGLKGASTVKGLIGRGAANAGGQSLLQGFGEGEGGFANRVKEAGIQGVIGTALGGVLGSVGGVLTKDKKLAKQAVLQKTGKDLRQLTNDAYEAADNAGVVYNGNDITSTLAKTMKDIRSNGYFAPEVSDHDDKLNKLMDHVLDNVQSKTTTGGTKPRDMTFSQLETMRKGLKEKMVQMKDPRLMGVVKAIDKIINTNAQGSELASAAREASRIERNTKLFDKLVDNANISSTASGSSKITALRRSAAKMLTNAKTSPFLDDEEKAVLNSVINAGHTSDFERFVARYDPSTSHYATLASSLWVMNHPFLGTAAAGLGYSARKLGEQSAEASISNARNVISGSNVVPPMLDFGTGGMARGTAAAGAAAAQPLATNLYQNLMNSVSESSIPAWDPNE